MKSSLSFLFIFAVHFIHGQKIWTPSEELSTAYISYDFKDIQSGKSLYQLHSDKLLNPASTIKVLTSLLFLEEYGADYTFKSSFGYVGKILKDGTLEGDIIFYGTGDPAFGSARYGDNNAMQKMFLEMVAFAQKAGITCVEGNIVVDASYFGSDCTPHTWQFNDLGNYYASGTWSTNINENAYKLSFERNREAKIATISPPIPYLYFNNELEIGPKNSGDQAYIFCAPYQNQAYVRGSIPRGKGLFSIRGAIPNAPQFIAFRLKEYLESAGIKSISTEVEYEKKRDFIKLWEYNSVPSYKLVKSALEKSINLYCESFFLSLGRGNRTHAGENIKEKLIKKKILRRPKDLIIADGSGLSQRNFLSTSLLSTFLIDQYRTNEDLKDLLALNGKEGTLKNAFTTEKLNRKIHGKSGSMAGIKAYTGILECGTGKELAFSIIINNYSCSSAIVQKNIERLLESVYSEN